MLGIDVAVTMLGLQEESDTKELMEFFRKYANQGDICINPANTPWCAAFVNGCERKVGNKGTGMLNARSFLDYGTVVELVDAKRGDIAVFNFENSSWAGHVTYVDTPGTDVLVCLGGNQSDEVCRQRYPTSKLLGIRRP